MSEAFTRKFPRRRISKPGSLVYRGKTYSVDIYEIGEGGIGVRSLTPVAIGHHVVVNVFVTSKDFGSIMADVVFEKPKTGVKGFHTMGFKFTRLPFETKRHIREFVSGSVS